MINSNIIKIASITKNVGLKKNYTHKSSLKNSMCGDFIEAEFILDKSKVISMRYDSLFISFAINLIISGVFLVGVDSKT